MNKKLMKKALPILAVAAMSVNTFAGTIIPNTQTEVRIGIAHVPPTHLSVTVPTVLAIGIVADQTQGEATKAPKAYLGASVASTGANPVSTNPDHVLKFSNQSYRPVAGAQHGAQPAVVHVKSARISIENTSKWSIIPTVNTTPAQSEANQMALSIGGIAIPSTTVGHAQVIDFTNSGATDGVVLNPGIVNPPVNGNTVVVDTVGTTLPTVVTIGGRNSDYNTSETSAKAFGIEWTVGL